MASPCRITQLANRYDTYERRDDERARVVLDAIRDRHVDDDEIQDIIEAFTLSRHDRVTIRSEISIIEDGAEMVRTLASTFAITPKVARKLREKRADYLRLVVRNDDDPLEAA